MRKREYKPLRARLKALETVKLMLSNLTFASQVAMVSSQPIKPNCIVGSENEKQKLIAHMVVNHAKYTAKQLNHLAKINQM